MASSLKVKRCIVVFVLLMPFCGKAQINSTQSDTLFLNIDSCESMFLKNNLQLIASRYNVSAQKAFEIQAKLFPNPSLQFNQSFYNPETKSILPFGENGESSAQLSQLIQLAGKRNKQIKLAQANVQLSQLQFIELLKTLRYSLNTDFYAIFYLSNSAKVYSAEINSLRHLVSAFTIQLQQGNVSEKEEIRVKAQLFSLESEYNDLCLQIKDVETELSLLLQTKEVIAPRLNQRTIDNLSLQQYPVETLVDSALINHPDIQIAKLNTQISRLNYRYQRSLAVPDLTFSFGYDQQGGYVKNLTTLGVGIDLPFFNRNQGNIKASQMQIKMSEVTEQTQESTIQSAIRNAYQKAQSYNNLYLARDKQFDQDFQTIQQATLKNYENKNISLLDFLDFYNAYKQNVIQLNTLQLDRVNAFEAINFYTGCSFFSLN
ncbi:TolC family protein [Arachidicoccus sp.]|uniref:TolC family protein n=1 Tax=Arachidicoccus sp. TaxID=1872624 RepID=UPI003D20FB9B